MLTFNLCILFIVNSNAQNNCAIFESFTFGVITDCLCGSLACKSAPKLKEAVDYFNTTNISFCAHLGDFIMNDFDNYSEVKPIYESLNTPHYYVFGNPEWDVPEAKKPDLVNMLNMPNYYYDIKVNNFRFIFIELSELAFFNEAAHPELISERDSVYSIYGGSQGSGGISQSQLAYIDATIALAKQDDDLDNVCNSDDVCPNFDDNLIGTTCNDNDTCTLNDVYTINCNCEGTFTDDDNDGVCDADDVCPNFDDNIDVDNDNIPDGCDDCFDYLNLNTNNSATNGFYSVEDYINSNATIIAVAP